MHLLIDTESGFIASRLQKGVWNSGAGISLARRDRLYRQGLLWLYLWVKDTGEGNRRKFCRLEASILVTP